MRHERNTPIAEYQNPDNAVSSADRLQDRRWRHMGSTPGGGAAVIFITQFTQAWDPQCLLHSRYQEALAGGIQRWGVALPTFLLLVSSVRMRGTILPFLHTPAWCSI